MTESARNWAVACPGPSLLNVKKVECDPGGLVVVNSAVAHGGLGRHPDWWAVMDPELFLTVACAFDLSELSRFATIWTMDNFDHHAAHPMRESWRGAYEWDDGTYEQYRKFKVLTFSSSLESKMPFGSHVLWRTNTFFTALALAVVNGAKKIRVYGADLTGERYFRKGFENRRTTLTLARWSNEAYWFGRIVECCAQNGVEVVRESYGK